MNLDKSPSSPTAKPSAQSERPQQMARQDDDVDRVWRECIAMNRFGARTEDFTFTGRRH